MNTKRIMLRSIVPLALLAGLASAAVAIVGRPLTPVSYAGVARRTAVTATAVHTTAVVATTAMVATTAVVASSAAASQQQAAAAQQQAAMAEQQAAMAQQQANAAHQAAMASALPIGTVVSGLPNGCTTLNISGVDYFQCGGTYYRTAFQSDNVVYVVSQP